MRWLNRLIGRELSDTTVELLLGSIVGMLIGNLWTIALSTIRVRRLQEAMVAGVEELQRSTAASRDAVRAVETAVQRMDRNTSKLQWTSIGVAVVLGVVAITLGAVLH